MFSAPHRRSTLLGYIVGEAGFIQCWYVVSDLYQHGGSLESYNSEDNSAISHGSR